MQTDSFTIPLVGEARFDASHLHLHRLISALAEAMGADLANALDALHRELSTHFAQEDDELRRLGTVENACHLDEHAAVLRSLGEVDAELACGNTAVVRRFAHAMRDWLPDHVQEMDLRLARHLFRQRTGGASIRIARNAMTGLALDKPHSESIPC